MRIALLSDIHANLPALEAVLAHLEPGIEALACAGDLVGYYDQPNQVCALIRARARWVVAGNHDAYVAARQQPDPGRDLGIERTRLALDPENRQWLASLPEELEFPCGRFTVRLRHTGPPGGPTYLFPDSPALETLELAADQVLVLGHTHWPMKVRCGQGRVINPGSVGQPRDGRDGASYATFDGATGKVVFHRVPYA